MKHHCPICKKTTDSATDADFPFCSERCRLTDLGAWAAEKYVVSDPIFDSDGVTKGEELPEADRRELPEGGHNTDDNIH